MSIKTFNLFKILILLSLEFKFLIKYEYKLKTHINGKKSIKINNWKLFESIDNSIVFSITLTFTFSSKDFKRNNRQELKDLENKVK